MSYASEGNPNSSVGKYWLRLHRAANIEFVYYGQPEMPEGSVLLKILRVKTGVPGEKPTPLPQLLGRAYWVITDKYEVKDNPETAPYFLALNIPVPTDSPYGPVPYLECNGQCNWEVPGAFGLHGVAGDSGKLSDVNAGSSGCIRHNDLDIAYLFHVLRGGERYYVQR